MDPRLDYLHDACVSSVTFDRWPERSICVRVAFHPDAGLPEVDGKLWLRDIWASRYVMWQVSGRRYAIGFTIAFRASSPNRCGVHHHQTRSP
jgi:hypothetical protein